MLSASLFALSANRAEISTSNLRGDAKLDNFKAQWESPLNVAGLSGVVRANYDRSANRDFLKEVSLTGELIEAANADDVGLGYQLTRDFAKAQTDLKLTASSRGTTLSAEYDTNEQLRSVGVSREVELGDQKMDVQPSWLLKARAARVKLMSSLNDGKDKVSAQVDFDVASKEARALELGLSRQLDTGRVVEAKYKPANSDLTISLTDSSFENGATWTATANVDASDAGSLLDTASVTLKRSWGW